MSGRRSEAMPPYRRDPMKCIQWEKTARGSYLEPVASPKIRRLLRKE